jgi:hypothetical protein
MLSNKYMIISKPHTGCPKSADSPASSLWLSPARFPALFESRPCDLACYRSCRYIVPYLDILMLPSCAPTLKRLNPPPSAVRVMSAHRTRPTERVLRRKTLAQIAEQTARKKYRRQEKAATRAAAATSAGP